MSNTNDNTPSAAESWPDLEITITKKNGKDIENPNADKFAAYLKRLLES